MDSLTPEWLKSLILDDPDGSPTVVAGMVKEDPDSCLNLLLVGSKTFLDPLKCDMHYVDCAFFYRESKWEREIETRRRNYTWC